MCGIFGAPVIDDSVRLMLPFLGIAMQSRGRDAWGASNGDEIIKHTGELTETWKDERDKINQWRSGIFHTRGASVGSAKVLNNAHPFAYDDKNGNKVIGIHNGCISNHTELDKKYNRDCSVDSMHIWMHLAEGKPWDDIEGWGNLAWWETGPTTGRVINLARFNSDNLAVAKLQGGQFVFASEMSPIRLAASMCGNPVVDVFHLDEYRQYWFAPNENREMTLWRSEHSLPFKKPVTSAPWESYMSSTSHERRNYGVNRNINLLDGYCAKCSTVRVNTKNSLLCLSCFNEMLTSFFQWRFPASRTPQDNSGGVNGHYPGVN